MRWGIGDGKNTQLLTDWWIPGVNPEFLNPLVTVPEATSVSFLIDEELGTWDVDRVNTTFSEEVATQVLQIPISKFGESDFASWPHTKNGQYSVRSAYNMARTEEFHKFRSAAKTGRASNTEEEALLWKKLWAITAPGKMKFTLWRFAHDCLPSGQQLVHRHIPASDACVFCGRPEPALHTLLFCPYAQDVWSGLKQNLRLHKKSFVNPKAWVFDFISRSSPQDSTALAVAFWHIWNARNGVRNNEAMKDPRQLSEQIKAYTTMIELHLSKAVSVHRRDSIPATPKWSPPPEGTVLINVDAALFKSSERMGAGVVIRNHRGDCLAACSELLHAVTSPELAEAFAMRRALALAREEGFEQVMVASDCLSVVQRIKSTTGTVRPWVW